MKMTQYLFLFAFLNITRLPAQVALDKVAQSTMNFLLVGLSPKASGMGDAGMALSSGAEASLHNPAGIAKMHQRFNVAVSMTQWIAGIDYLAGSLAWNLKQYGAIGIQALSVDYGTIHGTSLIHPSELAVYPHGYRDTGEVNQVGAYSLGITYGKALSSQFNLGGSVRLVGQNLGENTFYSGEVRKNTATRLVFDAGVHYQTGYHHFCFGMAIRNFSSNLKREEISEQLPLLFAMGFSIDLLDLFTKNQVPNAALTLVVDFLHPNNYSERVNFGVEYLLWKKIALRSGYQTNQDLASWSVGAGINQTIGSNIFEFNYSYSKFDIFDAVTRFSVGISL